MDMGSNNPGSPPPAQTTVGASGATATVIATAIPVAGNDTNTHLQTSSTIMIIVGAVIGILGVVGVIVLIWWMRRRALSQARYRLGDAEVPMRNYSAPLPPPKAAFAPMPPPYTQKALPELKAKPAPKPTRLERSGTSGSIDKDKALPIKPPESVWSSPAPSVKSPPLTSVHEMPTRTMPSGGRPDEDAYTARDRSNSVGSYKAPNGFI